MTTLKNITGLWRGTYSYDAVERIPSLQPVPFQLALQKRWFGRFTGTVEDDMERGMPGTGTILGYLSYPAVEFTKQMPVCYVRMPNGRRATLREYLTEHGHACERDVPHRPILYRGEFTDPDHAGGIWTLAGGVITLPNGWGLPTQEATGTWTMEKAD